MRIPLRRAASAFSRMPPTRSTLPRRVTSPVMDRPGRRPRWVKSEARAAAMATPALAPSFWMPPAGTWRWVSWRSNSRWETPRAGAWLLTKV